MDVDKQELIDLLNKHEAKVRECAWLHSSLDTLLKEVQELRAFKYKVKELIRELGE